MATRTPTTLWGFRLDQPDSKVPGRLSYRLSVGWLLTLMLVGLLAPWLASPLPFRVQFQGQALAPYFQPGQSIQPIDANGEVLPARSLREVDWREAVGREAWYAPIAYSYQGMGSSERLQPPGWVPDIPGRSPAEMARFRHWLGTDSLGHDVLAWMIGGTRQSLWLALLATLLAWILGALIGGLSGYVGDSGLLIRPTQLWTLMIGGLFAWFYGFYVWRIPRATPGGEIWWLWGSLIALSCIRAAHLLGRWLARKQTPRPLPLDLILNRIIEGLDSLPSLLLILALASLVESRSSATLLLLLAVVGWPGIARLVRAELLREKQQAYLEAGRSLGIPAGRLLFRHVFPNVLPPFLFAISFTAGGFLVAESTLSFLGLVNQSASWGAILREAAGEPRAWWVLLPPLMLISLTVISLHQIGQWWQAKLDPRMGQHHR